MRGFSLGLLASTTEVLHTTQILLKVASSVRRQVSVACTAVANPAARMTKDSVARPGRVIEQP